MSIQLLNPINKQLLWFGENGLRNEDSIVFPYKNGAFRIAKDDNYSKSFGYQWNKFADTQLDKSNLLEISKTRFFAETNWDKEDLTGKNILEVGSGAGRFSQIILDYTKANLFSIDYSNAIEANYKNNGPNKRLHLFQASIYELPFAKEQFDKVLCLGVLQHTPDFEKSVKALIEMAKPGAEIVVDFYCINGWWTKLNAKYILRPITKKIANEKMYRIIECNIDWMIKVSLFFSKIGFGTVVNRFIPICDIDGTMPKSVSNKQLRELCVLDTFDMFSPEYDNPQKISTVVSWFGKYGIDDAWGGKIKYDNGIAAVVKGIKK